jgi:hypothetical protein
MQREKEGARGGWVGVCDEFAINVPGGRGFNLVIAVLVGRGSFRGNVFPLLCQVQHVKLRRPAIFRFIFANA